MALIDWIPSDLRGTLRTIFGISSVNIKDNSGVAEIRNEDDSAYAEAGVHSVRLHGSNATHYVKVSAPAGLSEAITWVFPAGLGTDGQVWGTDGLGNIVLVDPISNAVMVQKESFTQATGSPLTIFTPGDNHTILCVEIEVTVAASGGSPTVAVGDASDPDRDFDETDCNLKMARRYTVYPRTELGASPSPIILTITPDGETFSGIVRVWHGKAA